MFEGAGLGGLHLRGGIQICGLEQEPFVELLIARVSHASTGEPGKAALKFAVACLIEKAGKCFLEARRGHRAGSFLNTRDAIMHLLQVSSDQDLTDPFNMLRGVQRRGGHSRR